MQMKSYEEIQQAIDNLRRQQKAMASDPCSPGRALVAASVECVVRALMWVSGEDDSFEKALHDFNKRKAN